MATRDQRLGAVCASLYDALGLEGYPSNPRYLKQIMTKYVRSLSKDKCVPRRSKEEMRHLREYQREELARIGSLRDDDLKAVCENLADFALILVAMPLSIPHSAKLTMHLIDCMNAPDNINRIGGKAREQILEMCRQLLDDAQAEAAE